MAYHIDSSWSGGFTASVTVTNTGASRIDPWVLTWTAAPGQGLVNGWNATVTQTGTTVTAQAPPWQTSLAPGQSWTVGYQGSGPSTPNPTGFALQGSACT
ncbi:MAG: cellulose binding domain-containing protein [Micromonosporaceae bacterium]|nr:cellulose binding domain-containing protein [Micromonosporaceae bacterium]